MTLTIKQVNYINLLIERRAEMYDRAGLPTEAQSVRDTATTLNIWDCDRTAIDTLKSGNERIRIQLEAKTPKTPKDELTDGMYRTPDGNIYKLQWNREKTNLYGKILETSKDEDGTVYASFEYAPGITRRLTLDNKMTLEEAKEYGALYGTCCVCARTLTNEASIEAGIGPICASKF